MLSAGNLEYIHTHRYSINILFSPLYMYVMYSSINWIGNKSLLSAWNEKEKIKIDWCYLACTTQLAQVVSLLFTAVQMMIFIQFFFLLLLFVSASNLIDYQLTLDCYNHTSIRSFIILFVMESNDELDWI